MKRNKEFFRNILILCVLAYSIIYFGNFYFTEEQCLEEIMKSMYMEDYEILGSYKINSEIEYTLINHENKSYYRLAIDDVGPLYRYSEVFGNEIRQMDDEHSIAIEGSIYNDGYPRKSIYVIYRNNENVNSVVLQHPDGNKEMCKEWNGNFCIFLDENITIFTALPHYVYDKNHELIEIIEY